MAVGRKRAGSRKQEAELIRNLVGGAGGGLWFSIFSRRN